MALNSKQRFSESTSSAEARGFDVDAALNKKGFVEFLAAHPDNDMDDESQIEKRFNVFNTKEGVKKDLKEMYAQQIEKDMGIHLDAEDLTSIDTHLESQAVENPDELLEMRNKIDIFREFPKQIAQLEKQLEQSASSKDLSDNLAILREDRENVNTGKKYLGKIGYARLGWGTVKFGVKYLLLASERVSDEEYVEKRNSDATELKAGIEARQAIQKKYGTKIDGSALEKNINAQIVSTESALAAVQEVEKSRTLAQEMFTNVRKELISGISGIAGLTETIQAKAKAQLEALSNSGKISELDKAQQRFEELNNATNESESGVDPLATMDQEAFQQEVDMALERRASETIMETILNAKLGDSALTKLEKALTPFLERQKIGSKEGDDARKFIKKSLDEAAENLGDSPEDRAKKLMVARILIKLYK